MLCPVKEGPYVVQLVVCITSLGEAAPEVRVEAVAVHILRLRPSLRISARPDHAEHHLHAISLRYYGRNRTKQSGRNGSENTYSAQSRESTRESAFV